MLHLVQVANAYRSCGRYGDKMQQNLQPNGEYMGEKVYQKTISLKEALAIAHKYGKKVTPATLTKWMDEHSPKLYHQPKGVGGKIYVFEDDFEKFISGRMEGGVE